MWATIALLAMVSCATSQGQELSVLPFLQLSASSVQTREVGHFDDAVSQAIHVASGFPFGNKIHNVFYIGANGYISFSEPFYANTPQSFPGTSTTVSSAYLVAPFWDDIDIRRRGNILYEIHTISDSSALLQQVNRFISPDESFFGTYMALVEWRMVHSWPDGESDEFRQLALTFYGIDTSLVNTFQAILITDGTKSYAIFTYRCGSMEWTLNGATIGYNAAGDYFQNHPNTGSFAAYEIACLNGDASELYNVVYNISVDITGTLAPPPTVEPAQPSYLDYLEIGSNTLDRCRNCSSPAIPLGNPGLPFGEYYHNTVYVGNNGIFSFGSPLTENSPAEFPTSEASTFYSYIVAPFWSNIDTRLNGSVHWQVYSSDVQSENVQISRVAEFINTEEGQGSIVDANWMLVATWVGVHPFPHGASAEEDRLDPYLQRENTFQGILISNGTQLYSVFTYSCDDIQWSDASVIGYNAGGSLYQNHPLSGTLEARVIGCVHRPASDLNNVVYDLSPVMASGTTPEPFTTVGLCAASGYTECCDFNVDNCFGTPGDCFCDTLCVNFGDCCRDQPSICQPDSITSNNTSYLLYADFFYIGRLSLDGEVFETLPLSLLRGATALDFDYQRGFLYWSDNVEKSIFRSFLNGSNPVKLVNTSALGAVEDIAVDWISNKLYWTETLYRRIEVLDLDTNVIVPVIEADAHSGIRGIAVDPITRYMYWTDWGEPAKIERASMDGSNRQTIHSTGLGEPNGITIDYPTQTIYWTDSELDVIEYSSTDGTSRRQLETGIPYPYAITVEGSLVFFTDLLDVGVHTTHKLDGDNVTKFTSAFTLQPTGIEVIAPNKQAEGTNFCAGSSCDHVCLLSSSDSRGYSCVCQSGYTLDSNGNTCSYTGTVAPPEEGSCSDSGYDGCCNGGFCAGSPPNCFCDSQCHSRDDCCSDIDSVCPATPTSCRNAGHDTCCVGVDCVGESDGAACYCDESCRGFGDCCDDIDSICPLATPATTTPTDTTMATTRTTMATTRTTMTTTRTTMATTRTMTTAPSVMTGTLPPPCNTALPESVNSLTVTSVSANTIRVEWVRSLTDTPLCPDDYILVNVVPYTPNQQGSGIFQSVDDSSFTIISSSLLEKWTPFNVSVTARNSVGSSDPELQVIFTEEGVPPIPPNNIAVKKISATEISVSWDPLSIEEARGFVISYTVAYTETSSVAETQTKRQVSVKRQEVPGNMTSVIIGDLQSGVSYSVSVGANTAAGAGVTSGLFTSGTSPVSQPNTGAIAGGVIGVLIALVLLSAVVLFLIALARGKMKRGISVGQYVEFKKEDEADSVSINSSSANISAFVSSSPSAKPANLVETMSYKQLQNQSDSLTTSEPPRYVDVTTDNHTYDQLQSAPVANTPPFSTSTGDYDKLDTVPLTDNMEPLSSSTGVYENLDTVPLVPNAQPLSSSTGVYDKLDTVLGEEEKIDLGSQIN